MTANYPHRQSVRSCATSTANPCPQSIHDQSGDMTRGSRFDYKPGRPASYFVNRRAKMIQAVSIAHLFCSSAQVHSSSRRQPAEPQISPFYPGHALPLTKLTFCVRDVIAVQTRNRRARASSGVRDVGQSASAFRPRPVRGHDARKPVRFYVGGGRVNLLLAPSPFCAPN